MATGDTGPFDDDTAADLPTPSATPSPRDEKPCPEVFSRGPSTLGGGAPRRRAAHLVIRGSVPDADRTWSALSPFSGRGGGLRLILCSVAEWISAKAAVARLVRQGIPRTRARKSHVPVRVVRVHPAPVKCVEVLLLARLPGPPGES